MAVRYRILAAGQAFLNTMQAAGWNTTGLEPDETARKKAFELYNLQPQSPKLFQLATAIFNAITMWYAVSMHGTACLSITVSLIAPRKIFIAVPNYLSGDVNCIMNTGCFGDVPRHLYHFSPASMRQTYRLAGFRLKAVKPMWFDSFAWSMLSEQYKTGKEILLKQTNGFANNRVIANKEKCRTGIIEKGKVDY